VLRAVRSLCFVLCACGDGGSILEVELALPASDEACVALIHARVQALFERESGVPDDCGFGTAWSNVAMHDGIVLGEDPQAVPISIVAGDEDVSQPVCLRVRFCAGPRCDELVDAEAPEATARIEPAFAADRYTRATIEVPTSCTSSPLGTIAATAE
jgi:hypothetical protein